MKKVGRPFRKTWRLILNYWKSRSSSFFKFLSTESRWQPTQVDRPRAPTPLNRERISFRAGDRFRRISVGEIQSPKKWRQTLGWWILLISLEDRRSSHGSTPLFILIFPKSRRFLPIPLISILFPFLLVSNSLETFFIWPIWLPLFRILEV